MSCFLPKRIAACVAAWLAIAAGAVLAADPQWAATLKPEVNPELVDLPDDTWKLMQPQGDKFDHPKGEVGLVNDEKVGGVVYFGGCSARPDSICTTWSTTRRTR
ncbi:MAG: hypothetical protein WD069_09240 [Planctomycetales bacterium]